MSDGTLSVRRRQPKASESADASSQPFSVASLRSGTFESFLSGMLPNTIGEGRFKDKNKDKGKGKAKAAAGDVGELKVDPSRRKRKLREYDRLLKGFKYSAALDSVLRKVSHR